MPKRYLDYNVLKAAKQRINYVFDNFNKINVSFSGGKDSTVMLHLVMEEAIKRNRKVAVMFLDWECQFKITIDFIESMYEKYKDYIIPYWLCIPITTDNSCSMIEPEFTAWDNNKKDLWIREKNKISIKDGSIFDFYKEGMTFEDFIPLWCHWYSDGVDCASFVGIRTQESLNRFRAISKFKSTYKGLKWTTQISSVAYSVYPIYDWTMEDIWTYYGRFNKEYNKLYDRMYQAGIPYGKMRIDEPFGDTQREQLWLYSVVESETWSKMTARLAGINTGALYSNTSGNILGNKKITLPQGYTWEKFANFLLDTMPPKTANHYKNKIAVYLNWYKNKGFDKIPDDEEDKEKPSWRLICKTLLRNDYWCRWLGFSPTKLDAYDKYNQLMKIRREKWNIYSEK